MEKKESSKEEEYNILEEKFDNKKKIDDKKIYNCFIIMPIGKKGTIEHRNNTKVYEKIIKPCVENGSYNIRCYHADLIGRPGSIPEQIIKALYEDDIVIADLRKQNPNVIWELGVRHAFFKRSIMICSDYNETFFDTSTYRVAKYNIDGSSNKEFFDKLSEFIADIIKNPDGADNPIMHHKPKVLSSKSEKIL